MKRLLAALLLFIAGVANAGDFYVGGAISHGRLRYDVDAWVQKRLDQNNLREEIAVFERLGGNVSYQTQLSATGGKLFVGYHQSELFSYELGLRAYGARTLRADADASGEVFNWQREVKGHQLELNLSASAHEGGQIVADATGVGASVLMHLKPVFFRIGAEVINANLTQTTVEEYGVVARATVDQRPWVYRYVQRTVITESQKQRITLPLIGIGVEYPLEKNLALRAEIEHVGALKTGFDFYSVGLVYKF